MQCYQTLAATTLVANTLDELPTVQRHLPLSVIADWMAENEIEAEDVLQVTGDEVWTIVENLIHRKPPKTAHAA
ncbi:MAG: hypothetical protein OEO19_07905 [Gammaproteobacteria bacterium]|nr:hypothetical protein [Gammaproteobacteria bacterium]MDH3448092.1 hypothetical protein [Gammaproteobacteria bacterium]